MAGNDEETKEEEVKGKGGGLKSLILVAVGAALGGAGVVFMAPPVKEEVHVPPPPKVLILHHPDEMPFIFNPPVERGRMTASIAFKFDYKLKETDEDAVLESIRLHWDRAVSRCLEVLSNTPAKELSTDLGKARLKKRLIDELTLTFFPKGKAIVDDVLWTKFVLQ